MRIRFGDYLRGINTKLIQHKTCRCKSHCHPMIFVCINALRQICLTTLTLPIKFGIIGIMNHISQFTHLGFQCIDTVGFFNFQTLKAIKRKVFPARHMSLQMFGAKSGCSTKSYSKRSTRFPDLRSSTPDAV